MGYLADRGRSVKIALAFLTPTSFGTLAPKSTFLDEFSLVGFYKLSSDTTIVAS